MSAEDGRLFSHGRGNFVYFGVESEPEPRVGIFMKGGCDLMGVFVAIPLIRETMSGSCAMFMQGIGVSDARPDILLQSRQELPEELLEDVIAPKGEGYWESPSGDQFNLPLEYFRPVLFEKTFVASGFERFGEFPKTLVGLSIGPAVLRTAYRHRKHGYFVDPGGFWLNQSMEKRLDSVERARWFAENFESVGWMSAEEFYDSFGEVVRLVKEEVGAPVLVLNTLVVDTASPIHNYQFAASNHAVRRRRFDVAVRDLSRELDFFILDVDKALKMSEVSKAFDYAHYPVDFMKPIGKEAYRILRELEVV